MYLFYTPPLVSKGAEKNKGSKLIVYKCALSGGTEKPLYFTTKSHKGISQRTQSAVSLLVYRVLEICCHELHGMQNTQNIMVCCFYIPLGMHPGMQTGFVGCIFYRKMYS